MSQENLKKYQKQLFEYDYTLKKIDTIIMSARLSQEERELYQLNRESCQNLKSSCSKEMAEYARANRLSLLLPPLGKEEKDSIISSLEGNKQEEEPPVSISFMNLRDEEEYMTEEEDFSAGERGEYNTHRLPENIEDYDYNDDLDKEYLENEVLEKDIPEESSYTPQMVEFVRELKRGVKLFYGG